MPLPSLGAVALAVIAAAAEPPPPDDALYYESLAAVRYNPLGLQEELAFGYRRRLVQAEPDDVLFGNTYVWVGPLVRASPQFVQPGAFVKIVPIAVLELTASAERVVAIDDGADIVSGEDDLYTPATIAAAQYAGRIIQDGWQASLTGRLQAKLGPIAIRNTALVRRFDLDIPDDALFYDQTLDVVTEGKSVVLQNDADVVYVPEEAPVIAALRYTHTKPFTEAGFPIHRIGPVIAYKLPDDTPGNAFDKPTIFVLSQWHLAHAWRAGQEMSRVVPYVALGFAFNGTLLAAP